MNEKERQLLEMYRAAGETEKQLILDSAKVALNHSHRQGTDAESTAGILVVKAPYIPNYCSHTETHAAEQLYRAGLNAGLEMLLDAGRLEEVYAVIVFTQYSAYHRAYYRFTTFCSGKENRFGRMLTIRTIRDHSSGHIVNEEIGPNGLLEAFYVRGDLDAVDYATGEKYDLYQCFDFSLDDQAELFRRYDDTTAEQLRLDIIQHWDDYLKENQVYAEQCSRERADPAERDEQLFRWILDDELQAAATAAPGWDAMKRAHEERLMKGVKERDRSVLPGE